jgi:uncharacterized protein
MNCPVCKNVALVLADRQGIEIDYCPTCRGVWLDRGELDKLIERSTTSHRAEAPQGNYRGGRDSEPDSDRYPGNSDPRHKKKKGGLLGELFDF